MTELNYDYDDDYNPNHPKLTLKIVDRYGDYDIIEGDIDEEDDGYGDYYQDLYNR